MARPDHWEAGAPFRVVPVLDTTRRRVWDHSAEAYQPRVLRLDNLGSVPLAVFVECADDRTTRTVEFRLGVGGGDELRVRGAVFVDAAQLDAAGVAVDLAIACVDAETQGGDPNTDVRVVLPLGAPGAWTNFGWLPPGRRWLTVFPSVLTQATEFQFLDAAGVVRGGFGIPIGAAPVTVIHPPSCLLRGRTNGAANVPTLAAYAAR